MGDAELERGLSWRCSVRRGEGSSDAWFCCRVLAISPEQPLTWFACCSRGPEHVYAAPLHPFPVSPPPSGAGGGPARKYEGAPGEPSFEPRRLLIGACRVLTLAAP